MRERGVIQTFYARSPLQGLIMDYIDFENTIYALKYRNLNNFAESLSSKSPQVIAQEKRGEQAEGR